MVTPSGGVPKPDLPVPACPQNFSSLSCDYFAVNQSHELVCDLGNPMKAGASVSQGWKRKDWERAQLDTHLTVPFSWLHRSGVACGSLFLIFKTQRKPSSLTSRSSGRE